MSNLDDGAKIVRLEEKVKYLEDRAGRSENKITELEGLVQIYQAGTTKVDKKLDQIYNAVIGDELGNPGIIKRIANIEKVIEWASNKKSYIIGGFAGVGAAAGAAYWVLNNLMDWIK